MNKTLPQTLTITLAALSAFADNHTAQDIGRLGGISASKAELVAAVIILEAGGEGQCGMHAVANVIYNRARMDGRSSYAIVKAPKQFSCLNGVWMDSDAINDAKDGWPKQWQYALNLVYWGETKQLSDVTQNAYFYQRIGLPKRKWHGQMTGRIGKHEFFRAANRR